MTITYEWRGEFGNDEVNALHAEAFETQVYSAEEWDWRAQVDGHSLGWVVAREDGALVGFVNVRGTASSTPGSRTRWSPGAPARRGIGAELVARATRAARDAGCEWLHVDFEEHLRDFYLGACGFRPTDAGVLEL